MLFIGIDENILEPNSDASWFFHLGILSAEKQFTSFMQWLNHQKPIKAKGAHNLSDRTKWEKRFKNLKDASLLFKYEIEDNTPLQFFAGLYKKANQFSYDQLEHDLNNRIKCASEASQIGAEYLKKVEIDRYFDFLEGLRYAAYFRALHNNEEGSTNSQRKLLLIDDDPIKYKKDILLVLKAFGIEAVVHTLKIEKGSDNAILCSKLARYNSARSTMELKEDRFQIDKGDGDTPQTVTELLEYDTILVDLLMPDDKGRQEIIGVNIIRGLWRLAIDLYKDDKPYIADIIAFTLADGYT